MAAVDHESAIIDRLWAILEGRAAFTAAVLPGNRIKLTGNANAAPIKVDPISFPKVVISVAEMVDSLFTLGEQYAMRPAASFDATERGVTCDLGFTAAIDVFHAPSFTDARALMAEIHGAIRAAGPNLGITAFRVQKVGPLRRQNFMTSVGADNAGVAGARPLGATIAIPILIRAKTTDLLT